MACDEELPLDALQGLGGVVVRLEMNERGVCVKNIGVVRLEMYERERGVGGCGWVLKIYLN